MVRRRVRARPRIRRCHLSSAIPAVRRPGGHATRRAATRRLAASGSLAFPRAPRRMAGGESTTFFSPAYHRDQVEMVRTIESIVEKEGRSGRFVLVTWRTVYRNQRRKLLADATMSMIARP